MNRLQEDLLDDSLTEMELEAVTAVFRQFETGLREASINARDLLSALKCLGLNTMEQEIMDLINSAGSKDGLIYFPEFSQIVLSRYREESQQEFNKIIFKVFPSLIIFVTAENLRYSVGRTRCRLSSELKSIKWTRGFSPKKTSATS